MGGDTFPNTVRIDPSQLAPLRDEVLAVLRAYPHTIRCCSPKEVQDKDSFGDVDFVVSLADQNKHMKGFKAELYAKLEAIDSCHNGEHLSFLSPQRFQIDVLVVPDDEFDSSKGFYSNGDFSYCLGKMIYKFSLKWSSKGLSYKLQKPATQVPNLANTDLEITLTKSTRDAFEFLGFSLPTIDQLLDDGRELTQDQLIKFLEECRFYRSFLMNENARQRLFNKHRERRPMVRAFFEHCKAQAEFLVNSNSSNSHCRSFDCGLTEDDILHHFKVVHKKDELFEKLEKAVELQEKRLKAKEKFNGSHIENWVEGIGKRELGTVFSTLCQNVLNGDYAVSNDDRRDYYEWVLETEYEEIKRKCLEIYAELNGVQFQER